MVEANRTVAIPLIVPEKSQSAFHQTILPYAYCQQETVDHCWPNQPTHPSDLQTSKRDAENALYDRLRENTNEQLHSNLVQKAIKDATSAVSSCKSIGRTATASRTPTSTTATLPATR